jgi:hypothetical protein
MKDGFGLIIRSMTGRDYRHVFSAGDIGQPRVANPPGNGLDITPFGSCPTGDVDSVAPAYDVSPRP